MNEDLRTLVGTRLESHGLTGQLWSRLILPACDGHEALESQLTSGKSPAAATASTSAATSAGAFLASLAVQGFRGIGPKQTLTITPGPGITLIVGRNGSGKSSFAEALEVLFTGDSRRWSDRAKVWKEGWRNLHHSHPASIEAEILLEGQGSVTVACGWGQDADLDGRQAYVQPKGKRKTTIGEMGWDSALVSYRPFLSYNELGSMLDEGPSKLYDALSMVLGLEDLVTAQTTLGKSRLDRKRALDEADATRRRFIDLLTKLLAEQADDRASACVDLLSSKTWGLGQLDAHLSASAAAPPSQDTNVLTRVVALEVFEPEQINATATLLREADRGVRSVAGTNAETARHQAALLEQALSFHTAHGDGNCPVCASPKALSSKWAESSRNEVERLKKVAAGTDRAHQTRAQAIRRAKEVLAPPPKLLDQVFAIGLDGLDRVRAAWAEWHAGSAIDDLNLLADHLALHHEALLEAIELLKKAAAAELKRREDRWRPIASALSEWIPLARAARVEAEHIPHIKSAEDWLKEASTELRNQRFAPIADQAMKTWTFLRQQSNVELGRIELTGTKAQRRVALDVTVDGVRGAAISVMSQGELHALALSLFLPRATLAESPFRFVVIDDPVQSMDPARVDGLARALEETARTRQVIVFTHDDRLPDAVRRLQIKAEVFTVTRRPQSVVEIRRGLDPVRAHIEDALALAYTTEMPRPILLKLVPGFCRSALEAAFISNYRRRQLVAGRPHAEIEDALREAGKITSLAALALFDDKQKGGDVMKRLNQFGGWAGDAFKQCKDGVHDGFAGDLRGLIEDTERLAGRILEMR